MNMARGSGPVRLDRRRFLAAGAVSFGGAVLLGACGDDDDSDTSGNGGGGGGGGGGGTTQASLGLLPIVEVAPTYIAREQGIFGDHGLEVSPEFAEGGAVIIPSVESGDYQIGFSNIVSLLLAGEAGASFKIVGGGGLTATADADDWSQMWVLEDSDIEQLADLEGRRVAVNTRSNALEIVVRAAVEMDGGDHTAIDFVDFPFPDMRAAMEAGECDAIQYNEPFQTVWQQEGGVRSIGQPFRDVAPGEILAFYFVPADQADSDLATGFRDALAEANAVAAGDEAAVRAILPTYLEGLDPAVAEALVLPAFTEDSIMESSLERYAELMVEYGPASEMPIEDIPDWEALLP